MMLDFDTDILIISAEDPEVGFAYASIQPRSSFTLTWILVSGMHIEKFEGCLNHAQKQLDKICTR